MFQLVLFPNYAVAPRRKRSTSSAHRSAQSPYSTSCTRATVIRRVTSCSWSWMPTVNSCHAVTTQLSQQRKREKEKERMLMAPRLTNLLVLKRCALVTDNTSIYCINHTAKSCLLALGFDLVPRLSLLFLPCRRRQGWITSAHAQSACQETIATT